MTGNPQHDRCERSIERLGIIQKGRSLRVDRVVAGPGAGPVRADARMALLAGG